MKVKWGVVCLLVGLGVLGTSLVVPAQEPAAKPLP